MLRRTLRQGFSVGLVGALGMSAWAMESPLELIRTTVNQVVAVLQTPALQGVEHRHERLEAVRKIVLPQFDWREVAKRSLGVHWRARTEEERQEFTQLITTLVEQAYSGTIDRYSKDVKFLFDQERLDGNFAEVDTRIVNPAQDKAFTLTYRLHQVEGQWRIYDVVIENVSLVRNYRNQFHRIISRSSYANLVQQIKKKLADNVAP
jgi:phospholipid transport system substrate-binding protein